MATANAFGSIRVIERADAPFRYLLADCCFPVDVAGGLLDWFERDAPWRLVETDFYEQWEFSMVDAELPPALRDLVSPEALSARRREIEEAFGCALAEHVDFVAHRLMPGQRIGVHNDLLEDGETHRLTIQLNRGLDDNDGGFFMLFDSSEPDDVHRVLRPVHNTGIAFEIGPDSHHAISRMHGGERYTVIYSFHANRAGTSCD